MSVERIEAWLGVRNNQRFDQDMEHSAASVRKLRREADHLNQSGVTLAQGFAGVKVSLAEYSAIAFGALPIVLGLAGAVGVLTASLGAATLGAGALAAGFVGILGPAMLGSGIIIGRQIADFKKVNTALQNYQVTVASFGRDSKQAETALRRLNGMVDQHGGVSMLRAVRQWQQLGKEFDYAMKPGRASVLDLINQSLNAIHDIMPSFAQATNTGLGAIAKNAHFALDAFSGPEAQAGLVEFGNAFARISEPMIRFFTNVFMFFFRVARASIPYVIQLADGMDRFGMSMDKASKDPVKLGKTIGGLVSQTKSWWNLFKEVGLLIFTVLKPGAGQGQDLVDTLTEGVHQLRLMAGSAEGQRNIARFFRDSVRETKLFAMALWEVLGPLLAMARDAMPLWTAILTLWVGKISLVVTAILWLSDVLSPLGGILGIIITGFWGFRAALLAWNTIASITNFLLPIMYTAFWALAAAEWAAILPIALIVAGIIAIGAAFYLAYTKIDWFHNAVDDAFDFIVNNWPLLLAVLTGPIGLAVYAIVKNFDTIKDAAKSVINAIISMFNAGFGIINSVIPNKIPIPGLPDINLPDNPVPTIPMLGTGGVVRGLGSWITGDRGPELNTYDGRSVRVAPLTPAAVSGRGTVKAIDSSILGGGSSHRTIIIPVQIEGREISRLVAEDTDDRLARGPGEN